MSEILQTFTDPTIADTPTWWLILACGHWYHWTGATAPKSTADIPCPRCKPPIRVIHAAKAPQ